MRRKRKGAFTLYFAVIFMSILLIGLSLVDFARVNVYKTQAQRALEITTNSLMTKYSKPFQENYGFFMSEKGNVSGRADFLIKENFKAGSLKDGTLAVSAIDMNAAETKEQILEYMKYRGPLVVVSKIYTMFSSIKSIISTGDKFSDRLETELSNADFLEALDEYRYYVHGWTINPNDFGYIYIKNDKEAGTNGYFVRAMMDFASDNPYKPHIDMTDGKKFKNDVPKASGLEEYMVHLERIKRSEQSIKDWEEKNRSKLSAVAHEHDQIIKSMYEHLVIMKDGGHQDLDNQMDQLKALAIHSKFPDITDLKVEDYEYLREDSFIRQMPEYVKKYEYYVRSLPPDERSRYTLTGAETEWVAICTELNYDLYQLGEGFFYSSYYIEKMYEAYTGIQTANAKALDRFNKLSKYLEEYKQYIKKEIQSLNPSQGKEQDADYLATTLPKLEDRLKMAELMGEQIKKIKDKKNLFRENRKLLEQLTKEICIPKWMQWSTSGYTYYRPAYDYEEYDQGTPLGDWSAEYVRIYSETSNKFYPAKKELKDDLRTIEKLEKAIYGLNPAFRNRDFDLEKHKKVREEYAENVKQLHVDLSYDQIFSGRKESEDKTKAKGESAANPFKEALRIVGDMFKQLFDFGTNKKLEEDEVKKLPSYIYKNEGKDMKPDEGAFKAEFGGSKKLKKAGKSLKSWLKAIKDIGESFDRLASDPLGTIYVNEYIMTAFRSAVTGEGEYKDQINLRFQKKELNPKEDKLKLNSEIEYVIGGQSSDKDNNAHVAGKILALRVFPNLLYVLMNTDTNSIVSALASAITAFFPPLYFLVYIILAILWAVIESVVDVFVLRHGERIAFMKMPGEFMLSPKGFAEFAQVLAKIAVNKVQDNLKKAISNTIDDVEQYISDLGKEYIEKATNELLGYLDKKTEAKQKQIYEYVRNKYGSIETSLASAEASIDNYISSMVGSYAVKAEEARALGREFNLISKDGLMDSTIKKAVDYTAKANMGTVVTLVNEKLEKLLPGFKGTSEEMIKIIKDDNLIRQEIKKQLDKLRKAAEEKLTENVIKPLAKDMLVRKEELRGDLESYLNEKIDLGAEKIQKYLDEKIANVLNSDSIKSTNTTEKSNSFFKLGYEDYLRIYLFFVAEDEKMFRILDLIQLREGKEVNNYMAGIRFELGLEVPYAFLPRLISIAKKQSSAIDLNEKDYTKATFQLRSVAGY